MGAPSDKAAYPVNLFWAMYMSGLSEAAAVDVAPLQGRYRVEDLQYIFDRLFFTRFNTRLVRGGEEPLYLPADDGVPYHRVLFARGYFSSALHEVAHWCIAGEERRQKPDYGYWYVPDGRNGQQQAAFEQVEVRPQAIEWLLAQACGRRFHPSCDNLGAKDTDDRSFRRALERQVHLYCRGGLPERAQQFRLALCEFYGVAPLLRAAAFRLVEPPVHKP